MVPASTTSVITYTMWMWYQPTTVSMWSAGTTCVVIYTTWMWYWPTIVNMMWLALGKQGRVQAGNKCIAVKEGFKRASISQGNYRYLYCSKGGGICVGNGGVIEDEAKLSRARSRAHELEFQQLANTTCVITHTMWMWYWPTIVNLV